MTEKIKVKEAVEHDRGHIAIQILEKSRQLEEIKINAEKQIQFYQGELQTLYTEYDNLSNQGAK